MSVIWSLNTVKMTQLLCYARLALAGVDVVATSKAMVYQSLAFGELLAPYIPDANRLGREASHTTIIAAVKYLLTQECQENIGLDIHEWYAPEILGIAQEVLMADDMNINQALVLLEAMAIALPSNNQWLNGPSFFYSGLTAICTRGSLSEQG
jgi:hypothetical protein